MNTHDTIAAIATATGDGGISIIRLSGPESLAIADKVFKPSGSPLSSRNHASVSVGNICSASGYEEFVDEAVALVFRAPHSYTREDVVELQCHGGRIAARRALAAVIDAGARPADPGEFTLRAFLNGRIDLLQAEAVSDLIRAQTDRAADAAYEQLSGALSQSFNQVYDALLDTAGDLEATLDFGEDELPAATLPQLADRLSGTIDKMESLLNTWEEGHLLREGALVVISGKPNVGKSSLMNALLGRNRAIVTDTPGTTRDIIEEQLAVDGIPLRLADTAGLRQTSDQVEAEGIQRARDLISRADLHIAIVNANEAMDEEEAALLAPLPPNKTILLLNKQDLGQHPGRKPGKYREIKTCLQDIPKGLSELREAMSSMLNQHAPTESQGVISERHRSLLLEARSASRKALELIQEHGENGASESSLLIREALDALGRVTGRVYHDELLSNIFSRFCVGK
jgi:tRNA modification GTPase